MNVNEDADRASQGSQAPEDLILKIEKRPFAVFLVVSLLVLAASCAIACVGFTSHLVQDWQHGKASLCDGLIAQLDYKTLNVAEASLLSSISNTLSSTDSTCRVKNYTQLIDLGISQKDANVARTYLIVVLAVEVFVYLLNTIFWRLAFGEGCGSGRFIIATVCTLIISGLGIGSIYMATKWQQSLVIILVSINFVLNLLLLALNTYALTKLGKRGSSEREQAPIALKMPKIRVLEILTVCSRIRLTIKPAATSETSRTNGPAPVMMFNPYNG